MYAPSCWSKETRPMTLINEDHGIVFICKFANISVKKKTTSLFLYGISILYFWFYSGFTIKKNSLHKKSMPMSHIKLPWERFPHNYTHTNLYKAVIIEQFGCKLTKLNVNPLKIQYMISVSILESKGPSYRYFQTWFSWEENILAQVS